MNIYWQEFKTMRKSAIIWACAMSALALLFLSLYPTLQDINFKELLSSYPGAVRDLLRINLDYITSLIGLYSMYFSFVLLCAAIQAMILGVSILSRETRERTADFLLVKPVSRNKIVGSKLAAAFSIIVLTNVIYSIVSFLIAYSVKTKDFDGKIFFMVNLTMFFLQLIFLAIGLFVSLFFRKIKNVLPISLGFVFGFYIIGAVLASGSDQEIKRFLSPFQYFDPNYINQHSGYEMPYLFMGAGIVIVCIITSFLVYNKKDIHAVS